MTDASGPEHRPLRILMLGPLGNAHVEHMAIAVKQQGYDVVVAGEMWTDAWDSKLAEHGIPVHVRTWPTARWMRRLFAETGPDVVHAHWIPIAGQALVYGANPLVATAWGSDVLLANWRQKATYRVFLRHMDVVTADSAALAQALRRLGAPPDRMMVHGWGVDLGTFSPGTQLRSETRRELGLPPGPIVLSVRWLRDLYNPRIILRAFERLAGERDDITLLVKHLGREPPDLGPIRYPERVRIIGHVPYEEMASYYRAADVCVSIPSSDSSPRSVWEAMGCGTPCIVSDLPWVHELIREGQHALVVPISEEAVADAMRRVLSDQELADRLAREGRHLVDEHRDAEKELQRLCGVYESLARRGARDRALREGIGTVAVSAATAIARVRRAASRRTAESTSVPSTEH
jgi:glycosyltransferase involved in cell wall biosynthesis